MSLSKASHLDFQPTEIYTGVGETHDVYLLTRFFSKAARDLRVTRGQTVGWDEMRNANIILQLNHRLEQCRLKSGSPRHAPYFQAVLRAEVKDNHPISISYVTHHDLQIADQPDEPAKLPEGQQVVLRRR